MDLSDQLAYPRVKRIQKAVLGAVDKHFLEARLDFRGIVPGDR